MRIKDLFKRFRLAFPVFGILLGSCAGSLSVPTLERKNAIPDGAFSLSAGSVGSSLCIVGDSISVSSSVIAFSLQFDVFDVSLAFVITADMQCLFLNNSNYLKFVEVCSNYSDFTVTGSSSSNYVVYFGGSSGLNTDATLEFTSSFYVVAGNGFSYVADQAYIPSDDIVANAYASGYDVGYSEGYASGDADGYSEGYSAGFAGASSVSQYLVFFCDSYASTYMAFTYSLSVNGTVVETGTLDSAYRNGVYYNRDPSDVVSLSLTYDGSVSGFTAIPVLVMGSLRVTLPSSLMVDDAYYLPFWLGQVQITMYESTATDFVSDPTFIIDPSALDNVLVAYEYARTQEVAESVYDSAYSVGYGDGYDSGYYDMSVIADSEIAQTSTEAYNDGRASLGTEESAITNLFGSLVSVPISVLNGLMPLAIWNTPIISILVTLMVIALVLWLVRVLI